MLRLFCFVSCLLCCLLLAACGSDSSDSSDSSSSTAYVSLSPSINIEQGDQATLTVSYSNSSASSVTFTVSSEGGVGLYSDNSPTDNICTIAAGASSCTITVSPLFLTLPGSYQLSIASSDSSITVDPSSLDFNVTNRSHQKAYISTPNGSDNSVFQCDLSSGGSFESCEDVTFLDDTDSTIGGLFTSQSGDPALYTVDERHFDQCLLDSATGDVSTSSCFVAGPIAAVANTLSLAAMTDGTVYAYLTMERDTGRNKLYKCELDPSTGVIGSCSLQDVFASDDGALRDVSFNMTSADTPVQYAYVSLGPGIGDEDNGQAERCELATDGSLENCSYLFLPGSVDTKLTFHTAADGATYAYYLDGTNSDTDTPIILYKCAVSDNGVVSNCSEMNNLAITDTLARSDGAISFAATTSNGTAYAYFIDYANSVAYQCSIATNGDIESCTNAYVDSTLTDADDEVAFY